MFISKLSKTNVARDRLLCISMARNQTIVPSTFVLSQCVLCQPAAHIHL